LNCSKDLPMPGNTRTLGPVGIVAQAVNNETDNSGKAKGFVIFMGFLGKLHAAW